MAFQGQKGEVSSYLEQKSLCLDSGLIKHWSNIINFELKGVLKKF